ncbi:MAG TPA: SUMF1/EgtB/PvdO family nonheme iron enzyme [Pyrinomonadaceae bacterium]|jgi:serine/threonine protein kinase
MLEKDDIIRDYKLEKFLGRGQFGEVWMAEKQSKFGSRKFRHALKFLSNLGDEINLKAAEAEIDTWIEASGHPNVMSVFDMFVHKEHIIIVSEYAEGGSLKNWLDANGKKAPSNEKAVEMISGVLRGIEHLHSRNIVHRDLKPDNILLQGDFPRIADFGISRIILENSALTKAIGSPYYMSPESFLGSKSPQTDIWAAGVILYEMLTGTQPFGGETVFALKEAIDRSEPKPLPENIPPQLQKVIYKALEKDRSKRYQTAQEMNEALKNVWVSVESEARRKREWEIEQKRLEAEAERARLQKQLEEAEKSALEERRKREEAEQRRSEESQRRQRDSENKTEENSPVTSPIKTIEADWAEQIRQKEFEEKRRKDREAKENERPSMMWKVAVGFGGLFFAIALITILFVVWSKYNSAATNTNTAENVGTAKTPTSNSNSETSIIKLPEAPKGMAYVPGGKFTMGRDDGKSEAEKPAHRVSVEPFFMDIYETTNEQYAEFVKATNHKPPTEWKNGAYPNGQAKFPVVGVDWNDASDYAKWANKRLPSEEEWEFAARGANNFIYPWGNDWKQGNANVGGQTFAEVGKFKGASPFGIYDMVGNAGEWTASDFKAYPNGKLDDVYAGEINLKTVRGGSVNTLKDYATATYRIGLQASGAETYNRTGFRCVRNVEK